MQCDVVWCGQDGLTPLHCASRSGHSAVVQMLINHEAQLTLKTKNGLSPLHMAAQGDHVDCAALMLHHGAPIDDVTVVSVTCSSSSSSRPHRRRRRRRRVHGHSKQC